MLIAAQRLIDRLRQPRTRADDLADVRSRLVAQPDAKQVPAGEVAAALEVRALAAALAEAQADAGQSACARCATARPLPHGRWDGGFCCGGPTAGVFTDDELGALRLAGTTPSDLTPPPPTDHAGCAFRGPTGCSLAAADRPSICIHYVCRELAADLAARGQLARIDALAADLAAAFARFRALRKTRILDAEWGPPGP